MKTPVVIDASAAAAWLLKSQQTAAAAAFEQQSAGFAFAAPALFRLEIRNIALTAERRGIARAHELSGDIALLESRIEFDLAADPTDWIAHLAKIDDAARTLALTIYDAAYLELARRLSAQLASRDAELLAAARQCGLVVHDLR